MNKKSVILNLGFEDNYDRAISIATPSPVGWTKTSSRESEVKKINFTKTLTPGRYEVNFLFEKTPNYCLSLKNIKIDSLSKGSLSISEYGFQHRRNVSHFEFNEGKIKKMIAPIEFYFISETKKVYIELKLEGVVQNKDVQELDFGIQRGE